MQKYLLFICLVFIGIIKLNAQKQVADSLWQLVTTTKNDSIKFRLLHGIGDVTFSSLEEMLTNAKREVAFGEKYIDKPCQAYGYFLYARLYNRIGNYVQAQEAIVKASIIAEAIPDNSNFLAIIYNTKGVSESNTDKAIAYLKKGIAVCRDDLYKRILFYNVSEQFLKANQVDSALSYAQKSNEINIKINDTSTVYLPLAFGKIYLKLNQPDIAYAYFKESFYRAVKSKSYVAYTKAYNGMISYFTAVKNYDSVLVYQKKFFAYETADAYPLKVSMSKGIYEYYLKQNNKDSANKYLVFYVTGNDSLNNNKKTEELQQAKIKEELREKDLEAVQEEEKAARNHNLQLAFIAIGILSAVIVFLLLSNSFMVSHKVVGFLSILVLLVVFEFINLLIHPFLEKIMHHSPVLMLLGLVVIAALIIPLHHKVEHWTTNKLVEKNKAIRLANAKKTIEELGKKQDV